MEFPLCSSDLFRNSLRFTFDVTFFLTLDGTTDMTRTVHFGNPTDREKDAFTRVLKGFIAVATAVFPPNAPVRRNAIDKLTKKTHTKKKIISLAPI